ncbi:hypothetical protein FPV67DRAFT_1422847 [Lyophyllum atratum]|nr:hypothetical protein FPV67DRAFT_1435836 [Lyophyllum atratum]KAF8059311.1 hypothetical protein FPV67DRAFT_1426733 [Lyophyllum atratum]KAF8061432.1 hypothetical protein FPV67DRAFT_1422847 [Lyophyllum atratum]
MVIPQSTLPLVPSTPLPPGTSVAFSPAWDPSSRTPSANSSFPYSPWMESPLFAGKRIKVQINNTKAVLRDPGFKNGDYEDKRGLWIGTEGNQAKVLIHMERLLVPDKYVRPIRPEIKGEMVTALDGVWMGKEFVVMEFGKDQCVVRDRTMKRDSKTYIRLATSTLVVICP